MEFDKIIFPERLYNLLENSYTRYGSETLPTHQVITNILKNAPIEKINAYLNYRPPGIKKDMFEMAGIEEKKDNFIQKTIAMSRKDLLLSYIPFLNDTNTDEFVNCFLKSHLRRLDEYKEEVFLNLVKNATYDLKTEALALIGVSFWLDVMIENPKNTFFETFLNIHQDYYEHILEEYVNHNRLYQNRIDNYNCFIYHPKTEIKTLLILEERFNQTLNKFLGKEKLELEKVILKPLRQSIIEKEVSHMTEKMNAHMSEKELKNKLKI